MTPLCPRCRKPLNPKGRCPWCTPLLAWEGAEEGAERAADHAERVEPGWKDAALHYFRLFAVLNRGTTFLTEDARLYAEGCGLGQPPDKRAWGSVALRAKRDRIVESLGYENTSRGPSHACPRTAWRAI
jgi:hypothetical protein